MAAPVPAAPPRLPMMRGLALDEHPTHPLRDHLMTLAVALALCAVVLLLAR